MRNIILFLVCIWFLCASTAMAQTELEVFVGGYDPGSEINGTAFGKGVITGARVGTSFARFIGAEFSYWFLGGLRDPRKHFDGRAQSVAANLLLQLPIGKIVPFGTAGVGANFGETQGEIKLKNSLAWNVGGGIKLRRLLGPLGLRFDARYYRAGNGVDILGEVTSGNLIRLRSVKFTFAEVSAGILFTF